MGLTRKQRRLQAAEERKARRAAGQRSSGASRHRTREQSQYPDPRAADFSLLEQFDSFAGLRNGLRHVADKTAEWAGIPMPLEGQRLVIEPTYPRGEALSLIGAPEREELPDSVKYRNHWFSRKLQAEVYVYEEDGKIQCAKLPRPHGMTMLMNTLGCSFAWGLEQEAKAVHLLGTLVRHHQFKTYMLTGMFLEQSKRSGLTYLFRRLRPTVVLDARSKSAEAKTRILCALCLHPIGYYADTWAGSMTPTDDVVAHLMLMRGDEHMFWKRSSQHAPWRPEAGL